MGRIILAACAAGIFGSGTFAVSFKPLTELAAEAPAAQPTILDIRNAGFDRSHLPGAIPAPYPLVRGDKANPGAVPDAAVLEGEFERLADGQAHHDCARGQDGQ